MATEVAEEKSSATETSTTTVAAATTYSETAAGVATDETEFGSAEMRLQIDCCLSVSVYKVTDSRSFSSAGMEVPFLRAGNRESVA